MLAIILDSYIKEGREGDNDYEMSRHSLVSDFFRKNRINNNTI
jgi:hypothetical protein